MKTPSQGSSLINSLAWPSAGCAAVLLVTGCLLVLPALSIEVGAGWTDYPLLGAFLMYSSLVLASVAIFGARLARPDVSVLVTATVGSLGLLVVAVVFFGIGIEALVTGGDRSMFGMLIVPALISIGNVYALDVASTAAKLERAANPLSTTQANQPKSFWTLALQILRVLAATVFLVFGLTVFWMWFYVSLRAEIFLIERMDLSAHLNSLLEAGRAALPSLIGGGVSLALVSAAIGLIVIVFKVMEWFLWPNAGRTLSKVDEDFIERADQQVRDHVAAQGYKSSAFAQILTFLIVIVPPAASMILLFRLDDSIGLSGVPAKLATETVFIVVRPEFWSFIVLFFAAILLSPSLFLLLRILLPRWVEAMTGADVVRDTAPVSLKYLIRMLVRYGKLRVDRPFQPSQFLLYVSTFWIPYFLYPGLVVLGFSAYIFERDRGNFDLVTDQRVVVVDYWSGHQHQVLLQRLAGFETSCSFDDGVAVPAISILVSAEERVDVARGKEFVERLDAIEVLEERFRVLKLRHDFAVIRPLYEDAYYAFSEECVMQFVSDLDAEAAMRVQRLLRLEKYRDLP